MLLTFRHLWIMCSRVSSISEQNLYCGFHGHFDHKLISTNSKLHTLSDNGMYFDYTHSMKAYLIVNPLK